MPAIVKREHAPLERDIVADIREDLGLEPDLVLWRNAKWQGEPGEGRYVKAGLPDGAPDIVGILRGADGIGRFFALEVKKPGARTAPARRKAQEDFAGVIRLFGGFSATVESKAEARAALERARRGESA